MTPATENAGALLELFASRDIVVTAVGASLELDAPLGKLTGGDFESARELKPGVLRLLRLADGLAVDDAAAALLAMEEVDPDDVPACSGCGRVSDVQTLDEAWHCSACDPLAEARRRRTEALLRH